MNSKQQKWKLIEWEMIDLIDRGQKGAFRAVASQGEICLLEHQTRLLQYRALIMHSRIACTLHLTTVLNLLHPPRLVPSFVPLKVGIKLVGAKFVL